MKCPKCGSHGPFDISGIAVCITCGASLPAKMPLKEYEQHALRTAKFEPMHLSAEQVLMLNGALGLGGESGELEDLIKKNIFHEHPLDLETVLKELGDIHWYWSILCKAFNLDPDVVLQYNVEKLRKRYPNGFTPEDSIARKDVKNEQ